MEAMTQEEIKQTQEEMFVYAYNQFADHTYNTSVEKGFWDKERNDGEAIALMHAELSEGLEALRKDLPSDKIPEFSGIEEELADTIIRIMDYSKGRGLRVAEAIIAKARYNETRERMHGGKKF